jgi:hypothetical protein
MSGCDFLGFESAQPDEAALAVEAHVAEADPHPQYTTAAEAAAAAPVQSVNTKTGSVTLAALDIGASPTALTGATVQAQLGDAGSRVAALEGTAPASYSATFWADPSGNASATGRISSKPTTLDHALALASAGDLIVLAGGTHTLSDPISVAVRIAAQSERAAAISSAVVVAVPGVEIEGVRLLSTLTDTSAAAGTTRLRQCSITGATAVVAPAASQVLELDGCTFAALSVVTSSGGATVRVTNSSLGGVLTHATAGAVIFEVYRSTVDSIVCAGGGSILVIGWVANLVGAASINVVSGSATAVTLAQVNCGVGPVGSGVLILTGAPAGSVRLSFCEYNTLGSTIPANAITVSAGQASSLIVVATVPSTLTPPNLTTYFTFPTTGVLQLDPFGIYEANTSLTFNVLSNNVAIWADLFIGDPAVAGPIGAIQEPLGLANAQSTRGVLAAFPGAAFGSIWRCQLVFARSPLGTGGTVQMLSATHVFKRIA